MESQARAEHGVRWIYLWLFWSVLITTPWAGFNSVFMTVPGARERTFYNVAMAPAWSPDGQWIAFTREGLYRISADGSGLKKLNQSMINEIAWSPDSQRIAGTACTVIDCGIYTMNADGSKMTRIADGEAGDLAWLPNGHQIAFERFDGLYVINADGSDQKKITEDHLDIEFFSVSPSGQKIAFTTSTSDTNNGIYVVDIHSGQVQSLPDNMDYFITRPAWSPDEQQIAFAAEGIYVINADGTGLTNITPNFHGPFDPKWSPDGRQIAFEGDLDTIYVVNADGTNLKMLVNWQTLSDPSNPTWSSDSEQIAFETRIVCHLINCSGDQAIYIINSDSTGLRKLSDPISLAYLWAVVMPALAHLVLILGLFSRSLYVRRHTQQALLLAGLRTISSLVFIGFTRASIYGLGVWLLVNGSLWLLGTQWGLSQVKRGECWLMRLKGEGRELPRPWAIPSPSSEA